MIVQNAPSQCLEGQVLVGQKTSKTWTVGEQIARPKDGTGGTFSVGYSISDEDGRAAFLKATDLGLLRIAKGKSKLDQMADALLQQKFERAMLDICSGSGMNRIVRAIDYGEMEIVLADIKENVFFIIFERAECDIRSQARDYRETGISWIPRVIHNLTVATAQLHGRSISHNDIKPSNLLVFDIAIQKLSDLGRATCMDVPGPWDNLLVAGDTTYSAPEAWGYLFTPELVGGRVNQVYRKRFDLYMLGSLIYFLLTEQCLNQVILTFLQPEYGSSNWTGSFDDVIPYLKDSHGYAMQQMDDQIVDTYGSSSLDLLAEIRSMVRYLTEIDPAQRGDPKNQLRGLAKHDLQRIISRSELIARRLEIAEIK